MSVDEYIAIVKRLGLTPTNVANVFRSPAGDVHSVPDPRPFNDDERIEIIERIKAAMGITPESNSGPPS